MHPGGPARVRCRLPGTVHGRKGRFRVGRRIPVARARDSRGTRPDGLPVAFHVPRLLEPHPVGTAVAAVPHRRPRGLRKPGPVRRQHFIQSGIAIDFGHPGQALMEIGRLARFAHAVLRVDDGIEFAGLALEREDRAGAYSSALIGPS